MYAFFEGAVSQLSSNSSPKRDGIQLRNRSSTSASSMSGSDQRVNLQQEAKSPIDARSETRSPFQIYDLLEGDALVDLSEELNTAEVTKTFKTILKANNITNTALAKVVFNFDRSHISVLLNYPKPWIECSRRSKSMYAKINKWSQSEAAILQLRTSCHSLDRMGANGTSAQSNASRSIDACTSGPCPRSRSRI